MNTVTPSDDRSTDPLESFSRVVAALSIVLIAVTARLWFPDGQDGELPPIPWGATGLRPSAWQAWIPSVVLCGALVSVLRWPRGCRQAWWIVSASLLVGFAIDQLRLQPWAYQLAIYGVIFAALDGVSARRGLIVIAASIYLYSAAGKFDFQFAHTVGQSFLEAVASPLGGIPEGLADSTRTRLALLFPGVELVAGCGLLFRITRPIAGVVVMLMHATLLAILGPWKLDHSNGVLVWNLMLLVQAYLLFVKPGWQAPPEVESSRPTPLAARIVAWSVIAVALLAPVLERRGYWDHWLSWSLYSPHTSRVDVEIHRTAIGRLPHGVVEFVGPDRDGDGWHRVALDRWSLATRAVPIYPQSRYQLSLAIWLADRVGSEGMRARRLGIADRWTGRREERRIPDLRQIRER